MSARKTRIDKAVFKAKARDGHCLRCGNPKIDGAHLLPRNVPYPRYDPSDSKNVISLCRKCHQEYDSHSRPEEKLEWLLDYGLAIPAQRLKYLLYGQCYGE